MAEEYNIPPSPTSAPPPRRTNTTMIIIVVVLLLICCCCAFLVFMYQYGGDWLLQWQGISRLIPAGTLAPAFI